MNARVPPGDTPASDVTVVMPTYNRAETVGRALDSIADQTAPPRAVIVVDDASTDDTVEVARRHGATVLTSAHNLGSGPARNRGIEAAETSWVAFLDSDDAWRPDHLARLTEYAVAPYVLLCTAGETSARQVIGNPRAQPVELDARLVLETSELVVTSACLASRKALVDAGSFRPLRRAQDLDMWVRLLAHGPGLALPDQTIDYFEHGGQASRDRELTLACFDQIVDSCRAEPWFRPGRDDDRVYSRVHWDRLRAAQRRRETAVVTQEARWFVQHPHAWPPLVNLLRTRRVRRASTRALSRGSGT